MKQDLPADEIVFTTGYQNMRTQAHLLFGNKVADRLREVWCFDEEGEWHTMWRQSGHPGFWFMGGQSGNVAVFWSVLCTSDQGLGGGIDELRGRLVSRTETAVAC